jgi:hypothetical protein
VSFSIVRTTENKAFAHRHTVVKAETKLQEHGLQQPAKPQDTGTHPQIASPEEFMQTMTPQSLGVKSGTSQTVYDVGLQPGEEMDFSDINFVEFSDFDHRYAHAHMNPECIDNIALGDFLTTY